jgi:carbonic anhydrase
MTRVLAFAIVFVICACAQQPGESTLAGEDQCTQSPIALDYAVVSGRSSDLKIFYRPSFIVADEHHDEFIFNVRRAQEPERNRIAIQGDSADYDLIQFHFHSPNEHSLGSLNGQELHFVNVFENEGSRKIAVVGVFIEEGEHNAAFDRLEQLLRDDENSGPELEPELALDLNALLPPASSIYRYTGSLTAGTMEPYFNPVSWRVFQKPISASREQLDRLEQLNVFHNARDTLPACDRVIELDGLGT